MIINEIEVGSGDSPNAPLIGSLTQLYGLISHIQGVAERYIEGRNTQSANMVRYLADSFVGFAHTFHTTFKEQLATDTNLTEVERSYLLHQAIRRLSIDWEDLSRILAAVSDPRIAVLEALVREAQPGKIWASEYTQQEESKDPSQRNMRQARQKPRFITVPYFGRHFELVRFRYAPQVFVTGIPLYNLEAPWDWHVVWHEMAGHVVNLLEENNQTKLKERLITKLEKLDYWNIWSSMYKRNGATVQPAATPSSDGGETSGVKCAADHGNRVTGFEGPPTWDMINPADWVAEIVEDSYGLLALGPAMYSTLERVLRQNYNDDYALYDTRHPPLRLRLDMAGAILLNRLGDADGPDMLKSLGFNDIEHCRELQPIAQEIQNLLLDTRYVRKPFEPGDAKLAEGLKARLLSIAERLSSADEAAGATHRPFDPLDQRTTATLQLLLDEHRLPSDVTIAALINASHLAFTEQPRAALRISMIIKHVVAIMQAPEARMEPLVPVTPADFRWLLEGKTREQLLSDSFSTIDAAYPRTHVHNGSEAVSLEWDTSHGKHVFSHTKAQHL